MDFSRVSPANSAKRNSGRRQRVQNQANPPLTAIPIRQQRPQDIPHIVNGQVIPRHTATQTTLVSIIEIFNSSKSSFLLLSIAKNSSPTSIRLGNPRTTKFSLAPGSCPPRTPLRKSSLFALSPNSVSYKSTPTYSTHSPGTSQRSPKKNK